MLIEVSPVIYVGVDSLGPNQVSQLRGVPDSYALSLYATTNY